MWRRYKHTISKLNDSFVHRHIGPRNADTLKMLQTLNVNSLSELLDQTIPKDIRLQKDLRLKEELSETEALATLKSMAKKNKVYKSFIGMGYHECITPNVILRNVLENPGWYTAYTPYQAEVSQGRLESLLNFQTMVSDLTQLPIANASLLDEGTAAGEAMTLCHGAHNGKRRKFFVGEDCHPQTIGVMKTRAIGFNIDLEIGDVFAERDWKEYSGVLVQYPDTYGALKDIRKLCSDVHGKKGLVVAAADLLALTMMKSPGEMGADVAIGSAQRFGVPMMYGGPHAGYMATLSKYSRKIPGRIIGVSKDVQGNPALRMAMQTREQHIRRDKATSNICTAQALLANIAACYGVYHGPEGLKEIAERVHTFAAYFSAGIEKYTSHRIVSESFFDTVHVQVENAKLICDRVCDFQMNIRYIDDRHVGVSFGENANQQDLKNLLRAFGAMSVDVSSMEQRAQQILETSIPNSLKRTSEYMTHPIFNKHHSETQMLRYLKRLENKDLSLNTSMISLGSCTMKLNAVSELLPISWPEFANIHPFVPKDQHVGYDEMINTLHDSLAKITGFAAISSQPNSGAQGEYAGLMCIKKYHESQGHAIRNVCLIPISAHGTNPASAVMAGMKVVVVKSDDNGNINGDDLAAKVALHSDKLSAIMLTYPSTYGVFEEGVKDICKLIHDNGGQVYMDGANMNAQVGLCNPYDIGADVCHLNLHKTFCIPHGGGGPGVGTIGVSKHLAPFLPGNAVIPTGGEGECVDAKDSAAVSSSPFGSAGILPISWMYIHMLGEPGLKKATSHAILHANYMAQRLDGAYNVLFRGKNGRVAHEFMIDIRQFKKHGIVEEDIAKRLQDFGFHSPTMSWPVSGTLMMEPTESEDLAEMDRFCEAMLAIRGEIQDIQDGKIAVLDSPLHHAPHTLSLLTNSTWDRVYSRELAAFPGSWQKNGEQSKQFWPSVGRIDNVHGDRNLICTCPPLSSYME